MRGLIVGVALLVGCQSDISTPFPPGLTPFDDMNPVPDPTDLTSQTLVMQTDDTGYIHVYGKGFIQASPEALWAASKNPPVMYATCSTDEQDVTIEDEKDFEFAFQVHYTVTEIVTVDWHDEWRYGVIDGTDDAIVDTMIKHQKITGSSFIKRSEGTIQFAATANPDVTLVSFTEHLNAVSGSDGDVKNGMQHNFDALVATTHGQAIPDCP